MGTTILLISPRDVDEASLVRHLAAAGAGDVQIVHLPTTDGAEELLLAQTAPIVVADSEAEGITELTAALRTEETFRLTRLLLLVGSPERARIRSAFADGADGWVTRDAEPGCVLISEETRERAGLDLPQASRSVVQLRGRDTEVVVYRLDPAGA